MEQAPPLILSIGYIALLYVVLKVFANSRNCWKDLKSQQPIPTTALEGTLRKFVINFIQDDVMQTLVTPLPEITDDL